MRSKWWSGTILAMVLVGGSSGVAQVNAAPTFARVPLPTSGLYLNRWAAAHMADDQSVTSAQANAIAREFDVITVQGATYSFSA